MKENKAKDCTSGKLDEITGSIIIEILEFLPNDEHMLEILKSKSPLELTEFLKVIKEKALKNDVIKIGSDPYGDQLNIHSAHPKTKQASGADFIKQIITQEFIKLECEAANQIIESKINEFKAKDAQHNLEGLKAPAIKPITKMTSKRKGEEIHDKQVQNIKMQRKI